MNRLRKCVEPVLSDLVHYDLKVTIKASVELKKEMAEMKKMLKRYAAIG